jgi:hypothetical protein
LIQRSVVFDVDAADVRPVGNYDGRAITRVLNDSQ